MSKPNSFRYAGKLAFVLLALLAATGQRSVTASPQDLPDGKGADIARNRCLLCHEADVIVAQKLTRPGWVREVEKMVRWGAVVKDDEKDTLVDYFAARFSPRPTSLATASNEARGKEIYEARCLNCHEADLIVAQRLSRPGWVREVEKMVRWGAVVKDDEKDPLVDYLFKNYPVRPLK
jgi:cytochrome c5